MRKSIAVFMIVVLIASSQICLSASAMSNDEEVKMISEFRKKSLAQRDALDAYDNLMTLFPLEDGNYHYRDDFAGTWIEDNRLIVALSDGTEMGLYKEALGESDKYTEFRITDYSFNELTELQKYLFENLKDKSKLNSFCVSQITNSLSFRVEDQKEIMLAELQKLEKKYYQTESLEGLPIIEVITRGRMELQTSIVGGGALCAEDGSYGSVGVCGTVYQGGVPYSGLCTAGHVVYGHTGFYYNGSYIGTPYAPTYANNGNGDFGFVSTTNSTTLTNSIYSSGGSQVYITSYSYSAPLNTYVMKYGCVGQFAIGQINQTGITYYGSYTINNIVECELISGDSYNGDSGGPYFVSNGSNYSFMGVHTGYSLFWGTEYIYFTMYYTFSGYFTPKTS